MEVTGQDSTLYLLAAKLIISQTFHYTNQTTASSLAPSLAFFAGSSGKQGEERTGRQGGGEEGRYPSCDLRWGPA